MLCIAKTASCFSGSPVWVQLNQLVGADGIPDTGVCSAPESFIVIWKIRKKKHGQLLFSGKRIII